LELVDVTVTSGESTDEQESERMNIRNERFYCYLPGLVLRALYEDPAVLDKLMEFLKVPAKNQAQLKRLPVQEKQLAIERQVSHLRSIEHAPWHNVDPPEVVAAAIWRSHGPKQLANYFSQVKLEKMLLEPVAQWLHESRQLRPHPEIPMGTKRADVVGYAKGLLWGHTVVAVELKNDLKQFERCIDQMSTFRQYAEEVYLACTPYMGAEYLDKHANARGVRHWDPHAFNRKLESLGFGLLLVMTSTDGPFALEVLKPQRNKPDDKRLKEVLAYVGA
jgi:hypothetical protein